MYPQGILDIIHQVIIENCPKEILERYPEEIMESDPKRALMNDEFQLHFKEKLPNIFNLKYGKRFIADMPFDTFENLIISLEFQSSQMKFKQKSRFNVYQAV